jgi:hypothetical protein
VIWFRIVALLGAAGMFLDAVRDIRRSGPTRALMGMAAVAVAVAAVLYRP